MYKALFLVLLALSGSGCVREVRVYSADPAQILRAQQESRLTSQSLSKFTQDAISQLDLVELANTDRAEVVERLITLAEEEPDAPWRLAATEILLDLAEKSGDDVSLYLACARQADLELQRAILHGGGLLDTRTEFAAKLNRRATAHFLALSAQAWLTDGTEEVVEGAGGRYVIELSSSDDLARFGPGQFNRLKPTDFMRVQGMRNHHRLDAYGAPAVAIREQQDADPPRSEPFVPPEGLMTAATVTLRFESADRVVVEPWNPDYVRSIQRHGGSLRLSTDVTAPIAELFSRTSLITSGRKGLTNIEQFLNRLGIYLHEPYDPNKIPVLMVHGLRSSPATWRDMLNGLRHDPDIRERYQFWMFYYPTGLPIGRSAMYLRRWLESVRLHFDPDGSNPAMQDMVVLGHSMGGLLTKAVLQDSGDSFWQSLHPEPFDQVEMPDSVRTHLDEVFFYEADEQIARVVFIATPHRGSGFANNWISRLGDWLIDLPEDFDDVDEWFRAEQARVNAGREYQLGRGVPSSIDDLQPDSPHLRAYLLTPMRKDVPFHLIAGDRGNGSDGIVPVESALIEGAESQLVVESGHEAHTHSLAIREVRRVLLLHLQEVDR